ncbi:hypothetical protein FB45DRAFT_21077 [Roridomyces roridus]|uniref:Uncharacterized protein n=1 Tax=Roridomyces roridus TaxID=1738132 RepID=A0AAD7CJQ0_9AGAR|nr:hypothetical protein FB45DRAFT_21077 [Roridomyces roridus]
MALPLLPLSDDFAVALGLKKSDPPGGDIPEGQEFTRWRIVRMFMFQNEETPGEHQDMVWARFCAEYLPATVDRLLNHLPVPWDADESIYHERDMKSADDFAACNPWLEMLVQIQNTLYLGKYLRSNKPIAAEGKRLAQVLAERVAAVGTRWDAKIRTASTNQEREFYKDTAAKAVQLLATVCTHFINERDRTRVISKETQVKLAMIPGVWGKRYEDQFLGDVSERMIWFMAGFGDEMFNQMRRMYKNWEVCGLESCQVRKGLKACGKCQTARYVSCIIFL